MLKSNRQFVCSATINSSFTREFLKPRLHILRQTFALIRRLLKILNGDVKFDFKRFVNRRGAFSGAYISGSSAVDQFQSPSGLARLNASGSPRMIHVRSRAVALWAKTTPGLSPAAIEEALCDPGSVNPSPTYFATDFRRVFSASSAASRTLNEPSCEAVSSSGIASAGTLESFSSA